MHGRFKRVVSSTSYNGRFLLSTLPDMWFKKHYCKWQLWRLGHIFQWSELPFREILSNFTQNFCDKFVINLNMFWKSIYSFGASDAFPVMKFIVRMLKIVNAEDKSSIKLDSAGIYSVSCNMHGLFVLTLLIMIRTSHISLYVDIAVVGLGFRVSVITWWRHQMETFSALLALCAGNSPVTGEFSSQRPVTPMFGVLFDLRWINGWVNNREAGDLRRYGAHYDVIVMSIQQVGFMTYVNRERATCQTHVRNISKDFTK